MPMTPTGFRADTNSTERCNGKLARGRIEVVTQRLGHGNAVLRAILPLEMALFSGQPDAVDPGQALGGSHGAHRGVDLALEYRSRRKGFNRQGHDGMTGICGSARLLDEIDDLTPESGLIKRTCQ